jgi:large subunit ribosomal protein L20
MSRIKRGKSHNKKRKKILKKTKGYRGGQKSKIRAAKTSILKAGVYAYRDRRTKKREMRRLWQIKINAGCRVNGLTYSKFITALKKNKIELEIFTEIIKTVR